MPTFIYRGKWNAAANTPALPGSPDEGDLYVVDVAGSTALSGLAAWNVGDQAFFLNGAWHRRIAPAAASRYRGTWNASTNVPALPGSPAAGDLYLVTVAGATSLSGITGWQVGDQALYLGGVWQKLSAAVVPDLTQAGLPADRPGFVANATSAPNTYRSTLRSIQEKLADFVSVLDYGADSTGTLNSVYAFRQALATGRSVYVPAGDYRLEPPDNTNPILQLQHSGQVIYGNSPHDSGGGSNLVFRSFGGTDANDCLVIGDGSPSAANRYQSCGIRNLKLECTERTGGNAISIWRCDGVDLDNLALNGPWNGIQIWGSRHTRIFRVKPTATSGEYNYKIAGSASFPSVDTTIFDCNSSGRAVTLRLKTPDSGTNIISGSGTPSRATLPFPSALPPTLKVGMIACGEATIPSDSFVSSINLVTNEVTIEAPPNKVIGEIEVRAIPVINFTPGGGGPVVALPLVAGHTYPGGYAQLSLLFATTSGVSLGMTVSTANVTPDPIPAGTTVTAIDAVAKTITITAPVGETISTIRSALPPRIDFTAAGAVMKGGSVARGVIGLWASSYCQGVSISKLRNKTNATPLYAFDETSTPAAYPRDIVAFDVGGDFLYGDFINNVNGVNIELQTCSFYGGDAGVGGSGVIMGAAAKNMSIICTRIAAHRYDGFRIRGTGFGLFDHCIVGQNGQQAPQAYDGIVIEGTARQVKIVGNQIGFLTTSSGKQRYGINVLDTLSLTGTTASGSKTVTALSATAGLQVGQQISGSGLAADTWIDGISGSELTLSRAATSTVTGASLQVKVGAPGPQEVLVARNDLRRNGIAPINDPTMAVLGVNVGLTRAATYGLLNAHAEYLFANLPATLPRAQLLLMNDLIEALVVAGVWRKLDLFYVFAAPTEEIARKNWLAPGPGAGDEVPLLATSAGVSWHQSGYISSPPGGFINLNTALSKMARATRDDMTMLSFARTNEVSDTAYDFTSSSTGTNYAFINGRTTANALSVAANSATASATALPAATSVGLAGWSRRSSSSYDVYKDGALLATQAVAAQNYGQGNLYVLGKASHYSDRRIAAAIVGQALTTAEHLALSNALTAYVANFPLSP